MLIEGCEKETVKSVVRDEIKKRVTDLDLLKKSVQEALKCIWLSQLTEEFVGKEFFLVWVETWVENVKESLRGFESETGTAKYFAFHLVKKFLRRVSEITEEIGKLPAIYFVWIPQIFFSEAEVVIGILNALLHQLGIKQGIAPINPSGSGDSISFVGDNELSFIDKSKSPRFQFQLLHQEIIYYWKENIPEQFKLLPEVKIEKVKKTRKILSVSNKIIILSESLQAVEKNLSEENIDEVHFLAATGFYMDADLQIGIWHGKNIYVVTNTVSCISNTGLTWDVSGLPGTKGEDGKNDSMIDGSNGNQGENGGHILVVANRQHNLNRLLCVSKGGRGGDGGNGRPATKGQNSPQLTQKEMEDLKSIITDMSNSNLGDRQSRFGSKISRKRIVGPHRSSTSKENYILIDEGYLKPNGQPCMLYYSAYDDKDKAAVILVKSAQGTSGFRGGKGGSGGVGGLQGTVKLVNGGDEEVSKVLTSVRIDGRDGINGKSGGHGGYGKKGMEYGLSISSGGSLKIIEGNNLCATIKTKRTGLPFDDHENIVTVRRVSKEEKEECFVSEAEADMSPNWINPHDAEAQQHNHEVIAAVTQPAIKTSLSHCAAVKSQIKEEWQRGCKNIDINFQKTAEILVQAEIAAAGEADLVLGLVATNTNVMIMVDMNGLGCHGKEQNIFQHLALTQDELIDCDMYIQSARGREGSYAHDLGTDEQTRKYNPEIQGFILDNEKRELEETRMKQYMCAEDIEAKMLSLNKESMQEILEVLDDTIYHVFSFRLEGFQKGQIKNAFVKTRLFDKNENLRLMTGVMTGDGKSIIALSIAIIRGLLGEKTDIVTSSTLLSRREATSQKNIQLCKFFDLSIGHVTSPILEERANQYKNHIVFGTAGDFMRDYVLDMKGDYIVKLRNLDERPLKNVIIDEVDNILIDKGNFNLYIAEKLGSFFLLQPVLAKIWRLVKSKLCPKDIVMKIENNAKNIPAYLRKHFSNNLPRWVDGAFTALSLEEDVHYVVGDGGKLDTKIMILDETTGEDLKYTEWTDCVHQFLQLKHGSFLTPVNLKSAFISAIKYFNLYDNIVGMTGTMGTHHDFDYFRKMYEAYVVKAFPHKYTKLKWEDPVVTKDFVPSIVNDVRSKIVNERSVLVVCENPREARKINDILKQADITKQHIFYPRDHLKPWFLFEGARLSPKTLIVSTKLFSRGTDVKISPALYDHDGLHVAVTFLAKSERILHQAIGRTARGSDRGSGKVILPRDDAIHNIPRYFWYEAGRIKEEWLRLKQYEYFYKIISKPQEELWEECMYVLKEIGTKFSNQNEFCKLKVELFRESVLADWSLWIDEQKMKYYSITKEIKNYEKWNEEAVKFLKDHKNTLRYWLEKYKQLATIEEALALVKEPGLCIRLAKLYMIEGNYVKAVERFNSMLEGEKNISILFEAVALYYKVYCIERSKISKLKGDEKKKEREKLLPDVERAKECFHQLALSRLEISNVFGEGQQDVWSNDLQKQNYMEAAVFLLFRISLENLYGKKGIFWTDFKTFTGENPVGAVMLRKGQELEQKITGRKIIEFDKETHSNQILQLANIFELDQNNIIDWFEEYHGVTINHSNEDKMKFKFKSAINPETLALLDRVNIFDHLYETFLFEAASLGLVIESEIQQSEGRLAEMRKKNPEIETKKAIEKKTHKLFRNLPDYTPSAFFTKQDIQGLFEECDEKMTDDLYKRMIMNKWINGSGKILLTLDEFYNLKGPADPDFKADIFPEQQKRPILALIYTRLVEAKHGKEVQKKLKELRGPKKIGVQLINLIDLCPSFFEESSGDNWSLFRQVMEQFSTFGLTDIIDNLEDLYTTKMLVSTVLLLPLGVGEILGGMALIPTELLAPGLNPARTLIYTGVSDILYHIKSIKTGKFEAGSWAKAKRKNTSLIKVLKFAVQDVFAPTQENKPFDSILASTERSHHLLVLTAQQNFATSVLHIANFVTALSNVITRILHEEALSVLNDPSTIESYLRIWKTSAANRHEAHTTSTDENRVFKEIAEILFFRLEDFINQRQTLERSDADVEGFKVLTDQTDKLGSDVLANCGGKNNLVLSLLSQLSHAIATKQNAGESSTCTSAKEMDTLIDELKADVKEHFKTIVEQQLTIPLFNIIFSQLTHLYQGTCNREVLGKESLPGGVGEKLRKFGEKKNEKVLKETAEEDIVPF